MKILVCALETSSNIHLKALKDKLSKDIEFVGIFDKSLGNPNYDISQMAVMGFLDVIGKLPFFLKLKKEMVELSKDVDKVLLMDSSGFNLPLAKAIKKNYPNKEIIYYILPQAWAWKKKRIPIIEKNCDKLCSIIPFEKNYYSKDANISYVGHPLLDEIKLYKNEIITSNKIAFMPGSRKSEIKSLMPIYKKVAKKLDKKAILIIPKHFSHEYITKVYGDTSNFLISRDPYKTLYEVEFAFICSGTATLEAALIGTPFILTYIAKPIDYFLLKRIVKLNYIGLANIFFEQMGKNPLHIELLQDKVNEHNLISNYNSVDKEQFLKRAKDLRQYLKYGSSKNVAKILEA